MQRSYPGEKIGNRDQFLGDHSKDLGSPRLVPSQVPVGRNRTSRTHFEGLTDLPEDPVSLVSNKEAPLPFLIYIGLHGSTDQEDGYTLKLLVPPSSFNISSSHVNNVEFTRNGQLPTLWGASQSVISLQGSSPAFLTHMEGLTSSAPYREGPVPTRKDSIGYKNFMSLVAVLKSNGYKHLSASEDVLQGNTFVGQTSRVIHVLDCVHISYDGTTYFGHFTDLSLSVDASKPYNFSYSMSFTVTGLKGDFVRGHIGDGQNQDSGIIIGDSAAVLTPSMQLSRRAAQVGAIDKASQEELSRAWGGPEPSPEGGESWEGTLFDTSSSGEEVREYNTYPVEFKRKFDAFLQDVDAAGYKIRLNSSLRDLAIGGQGTRDSFHNYGAAIDIQVALKGTEAWLPNAYIDPSPPPGQLSPPLPPPGFATYYDWQTRVIALWNDTPVPSIAKRHNLFWGGLWTGRSRGDCVHFQINTTIQALRDTFSPSQATAEGDGAPTPLDAPVVPPGYVQRPPNPTQP